MEEWLDVLVCKEWGGLWEGGGVSACVHVCRERAPGHVVSVP